MELFAESNLQLISDDFIICFGFKDSLTSLKYVVVFECGFSLSFLCPFFIVFLNTFKTALYYVAEADLKLLY